MFRLFHTAKVNVWFTLIKFVNERGAGGGLREKEKMFAQPAFFPLSTMFSKAVILRVVKTLGYLVKG